MTPPRVLDALLRRLLPTEVSEAMRGDLEEGWRCRREERGPASAWIWYLGQVLRLPFLGLRREARRLRRGRWATIHGPGGGGGASRAWQDLRIGARSLRRRPGFSSVVVVTLALREMGVRIALGAAPGSEISRLVRSFLGTAGVGTATGLVLALAASGFMRSFVLDLDPLDPWSYVGAAVLLSTLAGVAAWVPARRAAAVDPVRVLDGE